MLNAGCLMRMMSVFILCLSLPFAATAADFTTKAQQAVLVDEQTGMMLYEKQAGERMTPSSMSKLMTLYVVFDRIKHGTLSMEDDFPVSEKAWKKGGSKMFVKVNTRVSVADLLRGIIIQSGNDACIVMAEGISGSEENFAAEMNRVAEKIGLEGSHFVNSTGWPDPEHYMTARDLAVLSHLLIQDFPEHYSLFGEETFAYSGITQGNRNLLLGRMGVDGLKTGHTEDGGYGIAVSAEQEGRRMTAVVNGLDSVKDRTNEAERLLAYGFNEFEIQSPFKAGDVLAEAKVWLGDKKTLAVIVPQDVRISIPKRRKESIRMKVAYKEPLIAPVEKGQPVGTLTISMPDTTPMMIPLLAGEDAKKLTGIDRFWPVLRHEMLGQQ